MIQRSLRIIFFIVLVLSFGALAQEKAPTAETESSVPELAAFHDVIYPIWHTAYPEKDYQALKGFVPEINKLAEKVFAAELPGILRDKKAKWDEGLAELKNAVGDYNKAAAGSDNAALLTAAEVLHTKYEMLVRTIRPVLKEVDEFHKVLYVVYHRYLPDKKIEEIKAASQDLKSKAEAIPQATLSKRLEPKKEQFLAAAADLVTAATGLVEVCRGNDGPAIEKSVLKLHAKYQALEKVFD